MLRSVLVLLAALVVLLLGHRLPFFIVTGIGLGLIVLGFLAPRSWLRLAAWGDRFAAWVGRLLGLVLLTPVFYLVIVPGGLLLRLWGRDPLHRHFRPVGLSYWIPRRRQPPPEQYNRQFLVEDHSARAELRPLATDETAGDGSSMSRSSS